VRKKIKEVKSAFCDLNTQVQLGLAQKKSQELQEIRANSIYSVVGGDKQ